MKFSDIILVKHTIQFAKVQQYLVYRSCFIFLHVKWKQEVVEDKVEDGVFHYQHKVGVQLIHQYYQDLQLHQHITLFFPTVELT
jgi:hypothetical protein